MDETYGTYVADECFDVHDCDGDTDDDTDDGGREKMYTIKVPSCCSWVPGPWPLLLGPWARSCSK